MKGGRDLTRIKGGKRPDSLSTTTKREIRAGRKKGGGREARPLVVFRPEEKRVG